MIKWYVIFVCVKKWLREGECVSSKALQKMQCMLFFILLFVSSLLFLIVIFFFFSQSKQTCELHVIADFINNKFHVISTIRCVSPCSVLLFSFVCLLKECTFTFYHTFNVMYLQAILAHVCKYGNKLCHILLSLHQT